MGTNSSSFINPLEILRAFNVHTYHKKETQVRDFDNTIYSMANKKAATQENSSVTSVMLNDFAEMAHELVGIDDYESVSAISSEDMKEYSWWEKLFNGKKCNNIFRTQEAQSATERGFAANRKNSYAKVDGYFTQYDIFQQSIQRDNGIKFASNSNLFESALDFAKADINGIEAAYVLPKSHTPSLNSSLSAREINSYYDGQVDIEKAMEMLDLDGDTEQISPEEYAAYIMATNKNNNQLLTLEEIDINDIDDFNEIKELAKHYFGYFEPKEIGLDSNE